MSFLQEEQRIHFDTHPNITIQACRFSSEFYSDILFTELGINKPDFMDTCVPSRRSEYIAGRYCAQTALARIGIPDSNISKNHDQTPLWPDRVSGSISHSKNHAVAAVAIKSNYSAIGVDCESIISSVVCNEIKNIVATDAEQKLLSDSGIDINTGITLALSIKESLFKALFPLTGLQFDFLDVSITEISIKANTVKIACNHKVGEMANITNLDGLYSRIGENTLLTLIAF